MLEKHFHHKTTTSRTSFQKKLILMQSSFYFEKIFFCFSIPNTHMINRSSTGNYLPAHNTARRTEIKLAKKKIVFHFSFTCCMSTPSHHIFYYYKFHVLGEWRRFCGSIDTRCIQNCGVYAERIYCAKANLEMISGQSFVNPSRVKHYSLGVIDKSIVFHSFLFI